jgi:hypothetical protein
MHKIHKIDKNHQIVWKKIYNKEIKVIKTFFENISLIKENKMAKVK